jgi:hypothetical protein
MLAAVMSVVAWRMSREQRRRSDARVAALAAAIDDGGLELRPAAATLFSPSGSVVSQGQRFAAVAALGLFVVGAAAALAVVLSGGARQTSAPAAGVPAHAPLELLALEHDRDGDRLTVRGIVRNPAASATIDGLTAVVSAFDRDGGLIASGRAAVAVPALTPGTETPFVITVPGADAVDRYRVSFRTDDHVVPHLDRRAHGVMAQVQ